MERLLKGWNFVRLIRLALGIFITVQSILTGDWILGFAGLFLVGMAIGNLGCCGIHGCYPTIRSQPGSAKEIIYEEVDSQK